METNGQKQYWEVRQSETLNRSERPQTELFVWSGETLSESPEAEACCAIPAPVLTLGPGLVEWAAVLFSGLNAGSSCRQLAVSW